MERASGHCASQDRWCSRHQATPVLPPSSVATTSHCGGLRWCGSPHAMPASRVISEHLKLPGGHLRSLADAAFDGGTALVTRVQHPPQVFVIARFRPEDRVDLVVEDRGVTCVDGPEQCCLADVHGEEGVPHN